MDSMDQHQPDRTSTGGSARVGRRAFLRAAALTLTLPSAAALLAACGGTAATPTVPAAPASTAPASTAPSVAPSVAPSAAPRATVGTGAAATTAAPGTATRAATAAASSGTPTADGLLASPLPGVPDAYTKLPIPFKTVNAVPGKGSKVTAFLIAYLAPPPARDQNKYWQELEKRLGVTFDPILQPADGYPEKLAALTAGGNLPDLVFIVPEQVPIQYSIIKQGAYTDLTPYLNETARKEYPNVARFPAYLWKNSAVGGKAYGVPRPNLPINAPIHWRKDWAEKFGLGSPKNADELADVLTKFTKNDPDGNGKNDTFALHFIAQFAFGVPFFQQMFRVPNLWRKNTDGTLTYFNETDEFKQTLAYMKRLYDAGVYHPNTATGNRTERKDFITSGKVGGIMDSIVNFTGPSPNGFRDTARQLSDPKANVVPLIPMGFDGGKATVDLASGFFGFPVIPATVGKNQDRVKELLRVVDYFAAPFGSEERNFLDYGIEGVHHTVKPDGTRVKNDLGNTELGDLATLSGGLTTYYSILPGDVQDLQNATRDLVALGQENPVLGLYSPTDSAKGGELNQLRIDRIVAIVTGRDPLSAVDQYVKDWKSRGGDQIRKEYQDALKG
jgi:putative aldouronate transport system substrate-binding protein